MKVLVVEDEAAVAESIKSSLTRAGFVAESASDGESAWYLGGTETYAAAILDLGLPKLDGLTVLKRWRAEGQTMPVLILTARASWTERVEGIDAGADDYIPKPFHMEELVARLHAVLRRTAGRSDTAQKIGRLSIDSRRRSVLLDGEPIDLTALEYRLLSYFVHHPREAISSSDLLDHLYGTDHDKDPNVLEALLVRLRRKIGPDVIGTRRGVGYYLKSEE